MLNGAKDNNIIVRVEKWADCGQQRYFDFSLPDKKILKVCDYPKEDLNKIYKRLCNLSEVIIEYVEEREQVETKKEDVYDSIVKKLGFKPEDYKPNHKDYECDNYESPFSKLTLEEMRYLQKNFLK